MVTIQMFKYRHQENHRYVGIPLNSLTDEKFIASGPHQNSAIYEITRDIVNHYKTGIKLKLDYSHHIDFEPWTISEEQILLGELIVAISEIESFPRPFK